MRLTTTTSPRWTGSTPAATRGFATIGATCDLPTGLAYSYTGLGVRGTVPWIFEFNASYGAYAVALSEAIRPMIETWNIYDAGGR